MFKTGLAAALLTVLTLANEPHLIDTDNDDDTIELKQLSGHFKCNANTSGTYGYPNPPKRGGKVDFNIEGVWGEVSGNDLYEVTFDFYLNGAMVKSQSFQCNVEGSDVCPPPKYIGEDSGHEIYATFAHFRFDVPEVVTPDLEYDLHIFGKTKNQGDDPIFELEAKFRVE